MGLSVVADWDQFPPPATGGGGGTGTVTNIATAAPITGGPITTTGTISVLDFVASGASHARGTVPDPGAVAGTTKFLREDATWAVPAGGGGTPASPTKSVQFNNSGAFGGDANLLWDSGLAQLQLGAACSLLIGNGGYIQMGTAGRFYADTSDVTQSNRFWFQNVNANANTNLGVMPSGSATTAVTRYIDTSNPNSTNRMFQVGQSGSVSILDYNVLGGGTQGTFEIRKAGTAALAGDTSGNFQFKFGMSNPVVSKTGNYTILQTDCVIFADCTSGSLTLTLPAANVAGAGFTPFIRVKRIDSSANTVTISRAGADTIDGGTTIVLGAKQAADFVSDGVSKWGVM